MVHILRKNVSCKAFITNLGVSEVFRKVVSFKEVYMTYNSWYLSRVTMFSKVSLKAFVFSPGCILVCVPECLLVGKFDH